MWTIDVTPFPGLRDCLKARSGLLQVLTVHSNVRIENHTSHALQVSKHTSLDQSSLSLMCGTGV